MERLPVRDTYRRGEEEGEDEEKEGEEKFSLLLEHWDFALSVFNEREAVEEEEGYWLEVFSVLSEWKDVCRKIKKRGEAFLIHVKRLNLFLTAEDGANQRGQSRAPRKATSGHSYGAFSDPRRGKENNSPKEAERTEFSGKKDGEQKEDVCGGADKGEGAEKEGKDALDLFDTFHDLLQVKTRVREFAEVLEKDDFHADNDDQQEEEEEEPVMVGYLREEGARGWLREDNFDRGGEVCVAPTYVLAQFADQLEHFGAFPFSLKKKILGSWVEKEEELERRMRTEYTTQTKHLALSFYPGEERTEKKRNSFAERESRPQENREESASSLASPLPGGTSALRTSPAEKIGGEGEPEKTEGEVVREEKYESFVCRDRKPRVIDVMRSVCRESLENMASLQLHKLCKLARELRDLLEDFFFTRRCLASDFHQNRTHGTVTMNRKDEQIPGRGTGVSLRASLHGKSVPQRDSCSASSTESLRSLKPDTDEEKTGVRKPTAARSLLSNYQRLTEIRLYCEAQAQCPSSKPRAGSLPSGLLITGTGRSNMSVTGVNMKKDVCSYRPVLSRKPRKAEGEDPLPASDVKKGNRKAEKRKDFMESGTKQTEQETEDAETAGRWEGEDEPIVDGEKDLSRDDRDGERVREKKKRGDIQMALMVISKSCEEILAFGGTFLRFLTFLGCIYTGGGDDGALLSACLSSITPKVSDQDENNNRLVPTKPGGTQKGTVLPEVSKELQIKMTMHLEQIPLPDHALQSTLRLLPVRKNNGETRPATSTSFSRVSQLLSKGDPASS